MFGKKKLSKEEKKALKKSPTEFSGYISNYKIVNGMSAVMILALIFVALGLGTNYTGHEALWIIGVALIAIFGLLLAFLLMFQVKSDKRILELKKEQQEYDQRMRIVNKQVREEEEAEEKEKARWEEIEKRSKKQK